MSKEIEVYMKLARSPHPNICPIYGCVRDGPHVSGLALKHIPHKFPFVWKLTETPVSKPSILRGVKRGLDHLHNLGIVHNDINIANICLDESLCPVIIDFDSALGEGEPMGGRGGTPGWFRKSQLSFKENDTFGLGTTCKVARRLRGGCRT
ncbi:kinase-like domain-containing protein [Irpex rosettiformis]|uniref:Kinase-like domain-containing protein n=1 Tax=Irpex rosettiformis TaxID=378272 RepID=A0ACB8U6X2_9APHY|nr:kinase-like domain-containing protein [Irpex rosettiformis]